MEEQGRGVWRHSTILTTMHLHYTVDEHFKWEGWMITPQHNQTFGYIRSGYVKLMWKGWWRWVWW